jgi:tRNA threonylcarbamoyl adenosine modification protein YjeE
MCKVVGVTSEMSSPTFSIVNEYETIDKSKVYHMDLYRLASKQDIAQIGLLDYLDSGSYCFIEWPTLLYGEVSGLRCEFTIVSSSLRKLAIFNQ